MHIITGMLLSLLFSRKKQDNRHPLLALRWPVITKHVLPGRVRFVIPLMANQTERLTDVKQKLNKIEGVSKAETNAVTGSVLIHFDEKKLQPELLFSALIRLLNLEKELERVPPAKIAREINQFGKGLNQALYAQTNGMLDLQSAIPLALGLVGVFRVLTERSLSMPAAITMLWWSYNALVANDKQERIS
jgi:copper chaperone CopZ